MPSFSAPTSRSTFSVSRTSTASPTETGSPSCLSQRAMVASTTDSPKSGTTILNDISPSLLDDDPGCVFDFLAEGLLDQRGLVEIVRRQRAFRWAGTART